MSSMDKQGIVMETYQMLKKVGHFGVKYGEREMRERRQ